MDSAALSSQVGQRITVAGTAANAFMGAVVLTSERVAVYVAGLEDGWDSESGQAIEVTGVLHDRSLAPDPTVDSDGAVSHGTAGTNFVLDNPTWAIAD